MDLKKVKELIDIMKENDFPVMTQVPMPAAPAAPAADATPAALADAADDGLINIESPIVGTFYQASSPDSDPYIKVGDPVDSDTVVCIARRLSLGRSFSKCVLSLNGISNTTNHKFPKGFLCFRKS
ncbi:MAG: hypothetical protein ACYTFU_07990 [Planctomycetota bacterium]|jgi:acetyl-CoA carboxylase biotin carboxyl carrier protein